MGKLALKWRIMLPVGIVLVIGISLMVALIAITYSRSMTNVVNLSMEATAYRYSNRIKADLELSLGAVQTMASVFENAAGTTRADRDNFVSVLGQIVLENRSLFSAWVLFEENAFDGRDKEFAGTGISTDATGRFLPYVYMDGNRTKCEPLVDYDTPGAGDFYLVPKASKNESLISPYIYSAGGKDFYICTVSMPMQEQSGKLLGIVGGDLMMQPICDYLDGVKMFSTGYPILLDNKGNFAYHRDKNLWSKSAQGVLSPTVLAACMETQRDGKPRVLDDYSPVRKTHVMMAIAPVIVGDTGMNWVVVSAVPKEEAMADVTRGVRMIVGVGVLMLALALLVLYLLVNSLSKVLSKISEGIFATSNEVNSASTSIADASNSLAEGATEQASSLEETSSALEQMASMTRQNADNAKQTNVTNNESNKLIGEGADAVKKMSLAMGEINDSAEKISRIIKTIEDIAFQTNLLALNAAVEAARAGESGKGFAVVADEVRNLAGRSAQAARDTTELIEGTVTRVKNGSEIADELEKSFADIQGHSSQVSKLIEAIASATNEQAQGVDQVNNSMAQMDKVTQRNAANAEETASITKGLSDQAEHLDGMVRNLAHLINGGTNHLGAAVATQATIAWNQAGNAAGKITPPARKLLTHRQD